MLAPSHRTRVHHLSRVALLLVAGAGIARAQHIGWLGPSYEGAEGIPTASKPQSKLWWNDGSWWGCLWSADAQSFTIHRLLLGQQVWADTGTAVDPRPRSRADCLWDGRKLYVASHQYTAGVGGPGYALELYRYSYDPNADEYSLDVGFPTLIGDAKTETLVIDKDSSGTLWAVWMAGLRVWTAHTLGDDLSWSVPTVHPRNKSDLSADDIASIVRFRGRVGVMWSDQVLDAFRFTFHRDGEPASDWSPVETIADGPLFADDHISLRAAPGGRIFAAVKTTRDEVRLLVRSLAGVWSNHAVAAAPDRWTRPIVVLDIEDRVVHVFAASPVIQGTIYEKTSPMDALSFAPGIGTPVIADAGGPALNDPTSTKQFVRGATGLVVLASDLPLACYAHHHDTLGGPTPRAPVALFQADVEEAFAPADVQFFDASVGTPTAWSWTFGDGTSSTARQPLHTYAEPGRYTVSLTVANALGSDQVTRTNLIEIEEQPTELVLRSIADGHAREASPDTNYAGLPTLRIRDDDGSDYHAFVKFFVPPLESEIVGATLRLACVANNDDGGRVYRVPDDWSEPTLDWNRAPAVGGTSLGSFGEVDDGDTVEMNVDSAVTASGTVSFGIRNGNDHSAYYSSRQGDAPPELQLALEALPLAPATPGLEVRRADGAAPLTVQLFDTSNGRVSARLWDFGDGETSSLQNPSHTYRRPGSYSVSLTLSNASGATTLTRPALVRVSGSRAERRGIDPGAAEFLGGGTAIAAGSLEDAFDLFAEQLDEAGFGIAGRVERTGPASVDVPFRDGARTGRLRLQTVARGRVAAEWTPPPE